MLRSLSGLGLGGAEGDDTDFMPMMQDMMKNLLSKEVLYPSLKEISEKVQTNTVLILFANIPSVHL